MTTITTPILDEIAATGTGWTARQIRLTDGSGTLSIAAGPSSYCTPRPRRYGLGDVAENYAGPYTHVEVFPLDGLTLPAPWDDEYSLPAGCVPIDTVRAWIVAHGGEHPEQVVFEPLRVLPTGGADRTRLCTEHDGGAR